ncbi:TRAP transporter small permease subunit [Sulfitobacter mediterraneus]|uniref:TRAP transporter small permease subunit n=1 Tax=Sulfitobacter mediterraneus TaxID=83219 RepID=UPI0021A6D15D|nr:TRAP transporter small permease [Sulfitobacter mediterraneus]UWR10326.1 TRAP transporter small permease [Sulfitobacter mediterraneus]
MKLKNTTIETGLSAFGLMLLLAVSVGVTIEVLARKFLTMSLGGVDELSGYAFAIFTSFAFVLAALEKSNIRIDLLRNALPDTGKIVMDLIASISLLGFVGLLTWRAILLVASSFEKGSKAITPLSTPLYIPQAIWTLGLIAFSTVLAAMLGRAIVALLRRKPKEVLRLLGPTHEEDHTDEYTDAAIEALKAEEK